MRSMLILVAFAVFCVFSASSQECAERGGRGMCLKCPPGSFLYVPGCGEDKYTFSKPTCKEPTQVNEGRICDLTRCDCNPPTVWDEKQNKCVNLEDCACQD